MDQMTWTGPSLEALASLGLNAVGVADGGPWQEVLPGCRSVLVLGSGGTGLWEAFCADCRAHPAHLQEELHPLDSFVARSLDQIDPTPPESRRWVQCSATEETVVDFRTLALQAGLGWPSLLGLLISPEFGPWMGLRAACFTTEALPQTPPAAGDGPCPGCPAPCITACPATAVSREGWDVKRCSNHHFDTTDCAEKCDARRACPEGEAHRYGDVQTRYHYNRVTGRAALGRALDIANPGVGIGPHWEDWRNP